MYVCMYVYIYIYMTLPLSLFNNDFTNACWFRRGRCLPLKPYEKCGRGLTRWGSVSYRVVFGRYRIRAFTGTFFLRCLQEFLQEYAETGLRLYNMFLPKAFHFILHQSSSYRGCMVWNTDGILKLSLYKHLTEGSVLSYFNVLPR
jgi:hypothetical protein